MDSVHLPVGWTLKDCFSMIDGNHSGQITGREFEEGMCSLVLNNQEQCNFVLQKLVGDVARGVNHLQRHLHELEEKCGVRAVPTEESVIGQPQSAPATQTSSHRLHKLLDNLTE